MFADGIADNRSLMGRTGGSGSTATHDARLANVIAYTSPAINGMTVAAAYIAGAELASGAANVKGDAYSLAGMYAQGPITASLSYQEIKVGAANTGTRGTVYGLAANDKAKAWKVGGSYTMDAFLVSAVYEKTNGSLASGAADTLAQKNWYVAGKYNINAADAVKLAYTKAGTVGANSTANSDAKQISVGVDHAMSKRTTVYALYTKLSNSAAANYTLATTSTAVVAAGTDADPSAISIGMKHSF
jgi:predicted porin